MGEGTLARTRTAFIPVGYPRSSSLTHLVWGGTVLIRVASAGGLRGLGEIPESGIRRGDTMEKLAIESLSSREMRHREVSVLVYPSTWGGQFLNGVNFAIFCMPSQLRGLLGAWRVRLPRLCRSNAFFEGYNLSVAKVGDLSAIGSSLSRE
jgi:hypothetical protein